MTVLAILEQELIIDWQKLQLEQSVMLKNLALKAYYIKYALYRKTKIWNLELQSIV